MKKSLFFFVFSNILLFASTPVELYQKCYACHGEKGNRSALGVSQKINGKSKEILIKEITDYKNGKINKYGKGNFMKYQVNHLTEKEIEILSTFISEF